jgi:hypothetical protein
MDGPKRRLRGSVMRRVHDLQQMVAWLHCLPVEQIVALDERRVVARDAPAVNDKAGWKIRVVRRRPCQAEHGAQSAVEGLLIGKNGDRGITRVLRDSDLNWRESAVLRLRRHGPAAPAVHVCQRHHAKTKHQHRSKAEVRVIADADADVDVDVGLRVDSRA